MDEPDFTESVLPFLITRRIDSGVTMNGFFCRFVFVPSSLHSAVLRKGQRRKFICIMYRNVLRNSNDRIAPVLGYMYRNCFISCQTSCVVLHIRTWTLIIHVYWRWLCIAGQTWAVTSVKIDWSRCTCLFRVLLNGSSSTLEWFVEEHICK